MSRSEKAFWICIVAVLAFIAGVELGRHQERAENKARVAEFLAEQARPAEVPDVP